ncbi:hypothetical protein JL720_5113 [Aureococcus anophagefferens]|nr:hypothetical protein JL720_5113 [Aureococcus anophagefferens]
MMMMAKLALLVVLGISTAFDRNDHGIHGEMIAVYAAPASGSPDDGSREHIIARYTPMAADGMSLDLGKVPAYAEFVAARNISNVMPAGSNGESLSLTVAEREALLEAWVAAAAPLKLNVYMHIGSESIVDSIELARHAGTVKGCRGIVSMTPVYFKPTVDSLIEFLAPVAAAAPELPFWSARRRFFRVRPGTRRRARQDYNLMDFQRCVAVGGGKYNMLYGRDEMALSALAMGAAAAVSSTIGYSPTLRDALRLWAAGDTAGALEAQARNADLCTYFAQYETQAKNVQKALMKAVGMDVGPSRLPKKDLAEGDLSLLATKLDAKGFLDKRRA